MFETGLLILTRPVPVLIQRAQQILTEVSDKVSQTLYVHIHPHNAAHNHNAAFSMAPLPCNNAFRDLMTKLYSSNSSVCQHLDVYVLLGNVTNQNLSPHLRYNFPKPYDIVLTDSKYIAQENSHQNSLFLETVKSHFNPCNKNVILQTLSDIEENSKSLAEETEKSNEAEDVMLKSYKEVVMGGTFDRIHAGHKILLGEGCLWAENRLVIGVTAGDMNRKKVLPELISPLERRVKDVQHFIEVVKPELGHWVTPITDMYGPSITEPGLQCIVLSEETKKGGEMINKEREKKGLQILEQQMIGMVEDACHNQYEEHKISSSSGRKRLLGTLINPVKPNPSIPDRPYVIGLTGGIASGKSALCKRLEGLGAVSVDCDKLGHVAYNKGTKAYDEVIAAFGEDIVAEDGEINRKKLGPIVFGDPDRLKLLNSIVWPAISDMAKEKLRKYSEEKREVVVLEAALLLEAGWDNLVHEIWTSIVPREEAITRVMDRNKLPREEVEKRLNSQMSNEERVERANVVLCTLWEYDYTQQQVRLSLGFLLFFLSFSH
ncbi:hypothetical protein FSP39_022030 [Pinctada imbricata]|uniref:Bifunctional coenzyme A synthase n=1 Tax=Pinctada imbricata TaxID=66713 RepID=A0AA88YSB1_PINIB|nr:hypothetical protein FSP39_022030 [Pinctada imbricata]